MFELKEYFIIYSTLYEMSISSCHNINLKNFLKENMNELIRIENTRI